MIFYLKRHLPLETWKGTYWGDPGATRPVKKSTFHIFYINSVTSKLTR